MDKVVVYGKKNFLTDWQLIDASWSKKVFFVGQEQLEELQVKGDFSFSVTFECSRTKENPDVFLSLWVPLRVDLGADKSNSSFLNQFF